MEIDGIAEPLFVAEAATPDLDGFDPAVDALGRAVGDFQDDGIEDAPKVLFDRSGNLLHGLQTAANGPGQPLLPGLDGPGSASVMPQPHGGFFKRPGAGGFQAALSQVAEPAPLFGAHVGGVGQPHMFGAGQVLALLAQQLFVLLAADLVDRFAEVFGHMEFVECDFTACVGNLLQCGVDVSRPHVHGDRLNA